MGEISVDRGGDLIDSKPPAESRQAGPHGKVSTIRERDHHRPGRHDVGTLPIESAYTTEKRIPG